MFLQREFPSCFDGDELDITCDDIINTEYLEIKQDDILDYDGLQYFTGLKKLVLSGYTGDEWGADVNIDRTVIPEGVIDLEIDLNGDDDFEKILHLTISDLPDSIERLTIYNTNDFASTYTVFDLPNKLRYFDMGDFTDIRSELPSDLDTLIGFLYTFDIVIPGKVSYV